MALFPQDRFHFFSKKATHFYSDVTYQPGDLLVFGCETRGLPDDVLDAFANQAIKIPITDNVRSLNLSNACAVAAYEAMRQLQWTTVQSG